MIEGPSFTAVSGSSSSIPVTVPADQVLLSSSHLTNRGGAAYSFADGRAGDGVSAVTLILDDGTNVQATVANGWFVAWWPSAHDVKSAALTTPGGVTTQPVGSGRAVPCGPQPCVHPAVQGFGAVSGSSAGGGRAVGGSQSSSISR